MSKKLNDFERQNRKQMQNLQIKELPVSGLNGYSISTAKGEVFIKDTSEYQETAHGSIPNFDFLQADERKELQSISEEMAYVLIYRIINELSDIEKIVIRHQFGLPKEFYRGQYYSVKSRAELARDIKDHPYFKEKKLNHIDPIRKEIKHIREQALKKLFQHLWFSKKYAEEISELYS